MEMELSIYSSAMCFSVIVGVQRIISQPILGVKTVESKRSLAHNQVSSLQQNNPRRLDQIMPDRPTDKTPQTQAMGC